jgi:hypothetical protein
MDHKKKLLIKLDKKRENLHYHLNKKYKVIRTKDDQMKSEVETEDLEEGHSSRNL